MSVQVSGYITDTDENVVLLSEFVNVDSGILGVSNFINEDREMYI